MGAASFYSLKTAISKRDVITYSKNARRDIRRCIEFNLCPSTKFHVRGRAVESRRVQVHEAREDSPFGVEAVAAARDYCSLDAQRCWGMGFLLGRDCEEVARDEGAVCVVDRLVLPLLGIVYAREDTRQFPATRPEFAARLLDLRGACARAFRSSLGSEEDELSLFIRVYEHLTQPYAWTDSDRRALVAEYANRLLWLVYTYVHPPRKYFSGGACDLISAWCDDIIRRRRGPSSL
jgi:hypothetical protein